MRPAQPGDDAAGRIRPCGVTTLTAFGATLLFLVIGHVPAMVIGAFLTVTPCVIAWLAGVGWAIGSLALLGIVTGVSGKALNLYELLSTVAVSVGLVVFATLQRRRFRQEHQRARQDALTGLLNRAAWLERGAAEWSRAKRFQRPLTIAMLDGDQFKQVNDRAGHMAGDALLCEAGRVLNQSVRSYDVVARWGGDEFVILFPETDSSAARTILARLGAAVGTGIRSAHEQLTFSIGMVTVFPSAGGDLNAALAAADRLLYAAKAAGNRSLRHETLELAPCDDAAV